LFLFVAEGLTKIIQRAVYNQEQSELKCCRGAPGISHPLFADDSLLFFKATSQQATIVKKPSIPLKKVLVRFSVLANIRFYLAVFA
jgi:hypothetical protein